MENIIAYDHSTYNIGILDILHGIDDKVKYKTFHNDKIHTAIIKYNAGGDAYFNSIHGRIYFNNCMKI